MTRSLFAGLILLLGTPAVAQEARTLQQHVEARLAQAGPGMRFGLVVTTEDGREIVAINADQRFIPASNTKIVTTAAAFATLGDVTRPDAAGGASVRLDGAGRRIPDVILKGHGDARLSGAPDCAANCLATLADAVAAKTRLVHDIVGDDSLFPDERWAPGMSWEDIPTRSGTATSALTIDDNELRLTVTPGVGGAPPTIAGAPYFTIHNRAITVPAGDTRLSFDRLPNSTDVRVTGTIAVGAAPALRRLGIDDPAHYAAWSLRRLLEARGVRVTGSVLARHRPLAESDDPAIRKGTPLPRVPQPEPLARLTPPPLAADLVIVNKVSQNLHAELLLRRVALVAGSGSIADGQVAVRAMLAQAGVPRAAYDLSDGSGMSVYNRIAPRGMTILLRWIAARPWGAAWRETLPIGGVDGTLARRFTGTALEGRVFAKTGTLNGTSALSGYMTASSGRTLILSSFANDVPAGAAAIGAVEAALVMVAAEN